MSDNHHWRLQVRIAIILLWGVSVGWSQDSSLGIAPVREQLRQRQFLEGLVNRRLFSLAERFCRDRVRDASTSRAKAEWAARHIRVVGEHARQSDSSHRDKQWADVERIATAFRNEHADNAWLPLVDYQFARTSLTRAEINVPRCELGMMDPAGVLRQLRTANDLLENTEVDVSRRMRSSSRPVKDLDGPSIVELKALRARVLNSLGIVHLSQAKLYKFGTPDRVNASIAAIRFFGKISPGDVFPDLWDQVRLNLLSATRLKGDYALASAQIDRYLEADVSVTFQLRCRAEKIRLALAEDRHSRAQALVALSRKIDGQVDPELDIASLEVMVAQWRYARDERRADAAESWRKRALEIVAIIEREYSPYWLHRAETLISKVAATASNQDLDVLRRMARSLYLRGQLEEAVSVYDQGAQQAALNGDEASTFEMAFQSAAIQNKRGKLSDAGNRFRAIALRFPSHSDAARAHELSVLQAASEALRTEDNADQKARIALTKYEQLLSEHISQWPMKASSQRARLWLAKLYEYQQKYLAAAAAYTAVESGESTSQLFRKAKACYVKALEKTTARDEQLHTVTSYLRRLASQPKRVESATPSLLEESKIRRRMATILSAELQLRFSETLTGPDLVAIVDSLESLLNSQNLESEQWRENAHAILIVSFVRLGDWKRATQGLNHLREASSVGWLELLSLLAEGTVAVDGSQRDLGILQLSAIERLRRHYPSLSAADRQAVDRWRADALMRAGDFAAAQTLLTVLVERHPRDLRLREEFAKCLLESGEASAHRESLEHWRIVLSQSKTRSVRWFRAKFGIASAYRRLGQVDRASELIRLLKALHPEMGGDAIRPMFERLLVECEVDQH